MHCSFDFIFDRVMALDVTALVEYIAVLGALLFCIILSVCTILSGSAIFGYNIFGVQL